MYRDMSYDATEPKAWHNRSNSIRHRCGHWTGGASGYSLHLAERLRRGLCHPCWRQERPDRPERESWLELSGREA